MRSLRPSIARRARALLAASRAHTIECDDGTRLLAQVALQPAADDIIPQSVVLLHGWEGSAESAYVLSLGAYLFAHGCQVVRLNFRDHGGTHALNSEIFHSCRLQEVIDAVRVLQEQVIGRALSIAGFSLGGNFALRVAARAPANRIRLTHAVAVCPVLRPHSTMSALERGWFGYRDYFVRKWKRSLLAKQQVFPQLYDFREVMKLNSLERMTDLLVRRYGGFTDLDSYLQGYSLTGATLANLQVPSTMILAEDDPIIPHTDLRDVAQPPALSVIRVARGGHCGFMDCVGMESWADRVAARALGLTD